MRGNGRYAPAFTASPGWLRPLAVSAPWLTVILLVLMFAIVDRALTISPGVAFDLPEPTGARGEKADLVSLVMPSAGSTFAFFDDARYSVDDESSMALFGDQLSAGLARTERKVLLVLADRAVSTGSLMKLAAAARKAGAKKVLFAEKKREVQE